MLSDAGKSDEITCASTQQPASRLPLRKGSVLWKMYSFLIKNGGKCSFGTVLAYNNQPARDKTSSSMSLCYIFNLFLRVT